MHVHTAEKHLYATARRRTGAQPLPNSKIGHAEQQPSDYFALLAACLAALAAFRLAALTFNATDLFTDEAQYWAWSLEPAFGYYSKPPLIAWIIAATTPLCGESEFCVRLPAVVLHIATSLVIYGLGHSLYSARVGFWSAIAFATLPGISLSSGIISTDVPLLLAFALALLAFARWVAQPSTMAAGLVGAAIGVGLNAKYAMAYFIPCAAIFFLVSPDVRRSLRAHHILACLMMAGLLIAPNLAWNAAHGFSTLSHTADNANWTGSLFHPGKAAEFFVAQFGVFGPILFGALIAIAWRSAPKIAELEWQQKFLLAFSVPIVLALTMQGFLSRSLANWAAPAYVAATVLVVATLLNQKADRWLHGSLLLHGGLAVALAIATSLAGRFELPGVGDLFARTLGNRALAAVVLAEQKAPPAGLGYRSWLTNDRDVAAALIYYGRGDNVPLYAWPSASGPRNHFEQHQAFGVTSPEPVLFVGVRAPSAAITKSFDGVRDLGTRSIAAGQFTTRTVHLTELQGYRGR